MSTWPAVTGITGAHAVNKNNRKPLCTPDPGSTRVSFNLRIRRTRFQCLAECHPVLVEQPYYFQVRGSQHVFGVVCTAVPLSSCSKSQD